MPVKKEKYRVETFDLKSVNVGLRLEKWMNEMDGYFVHSEIHQGNTLLMVMMQPRKRRPAKRRATRTTTKTITVKSPARKKTTKAKKKK